MDMEEKSGYPDDTCETPDSLQNLFEFEGFTVLWGHVTGIYDGAFNHNHGPCFVGEYGTGPERVGGDSGGC